jgi:hypothetical protein
MALKRNHRGIEGYFYNSGNKKLTVQPGLIDKVWYDSPGRNGNLNIGIVKDRSTSFVFELSDEEDISSLFRDLQVSGVKELMKLPPRERLVLVYSQDITNYGITIRPRDRNIDLPRI